MADYLLTYEDRQRGSTNKSIVHYLAVAALAQSLCFLLKLAPQALDMWSEIVAANADENRVYALLDIFRALIGVALLPSSVAYLYRVKVAENVCKSICAIYIIATLSQCVDCVFQIYLGHLGGYLNVQNAVRAGAEELFNIVEPSVIPSFFFYTLNRFPTQKLG